MYIIVIQFQLNIHCVERQSQRKFAAQESLSRTPPSLEERQLIHTKYLKGAKEPTNPDQKRIRATTASSLVFCHPQVLLISHPKLFIIMYAII